MAADVANGSGGTENATWQEGQEMARPTPAGSQAMLCPQAGQLNLCLLTGAGGVFGMGLVKRYARPRRVAQKIPALRTARTSNWQAAME